MRRHCLFLLCLAISFSFIHSTIASETPQQPKPKKVLVIYNSHWYGESQQRIRDMAYMVQNLLGHFPVESVAINSQDLTDLIANECDSFIYIGFTEEDPPIPLVKVIQEGNKPVFWLGKNLDKVKSAATLGLSFKGWSKNTLGYDYDGKQFQDSNPSWWGHIEINGPKWNVSAFCVSNKQRNPYLLHKGSFWFIPQVDFWKNGYWIFADALHDWLQFHPHNVKQAFVRIEDIHPLRDPVSLRKIADLLAQKNIPFGMMVIPMWVNPEKNEQIPLKDKPELVEALHYMQQKGGTVILHGYTHQIGKEKTGEGFEFWDGAHESPLPIDIVPYVQERVERGILDLTSLGLAPQAYAPPHYAMPEKGYHYLVQKFPILIGSTQVSDRNRATQTFPYIIERDRHGFKVIPENLGFIDPVQNDPVLAMLNKAQGLSVVRDSTLSFFFHPYLDVQYLAKAVDELKARGYVFYDLQQEIKVAQSATNGPAYKTLPLETLLPVFEYWDSEQITYLGVLLFAGILTVSLTRVYKGKKKTL